MAAAARAAEAPLLVQMRQMPMALVAKLRYTSTATEPSLHEQRPP